MVPRCLLPCSSQLSHNGRGAGGYGGGQGGDGTPPLSPTQSPSVPARRVESETLVDARATCIHAGEELRAPERRVNTGDDCFAGWMLTH